ncbi:hypothetical protein [Rhodopila globiformis]|uniref:hypothetical protein n=1 Tax=Rhodopila globiformis TaxID=1071 RepID=UPI0011B08E7C|nr:hypothetical protein [Rhodopila globiformis]
MPLPGTPAARADGLISRVAIVRIFVPGVESQAQLADRLRAEGYTNVVMSSVYPTPVNPYPQSNRSWTRHLDLTPVHAGWNGVATKDGQVVQVYAQLLSRWN